VRSHAQKFFNKLQKFENQKKAEEGKGKKMTDLHEYEVEESENSFLKDVHDDASNTTPVELVALIQGESQKDDNRNGCAM
jgi:hypothetical protein